MIARPLPRRDGCNAGRAEALRVALAGIATTLATNRLDGRDDVARHDQTAELRLKAASGEVAALLDRRAKQPAGTLAPDALARCAARVAAADGIRLKAQRSLAQGERG